ncbi:VOC family protein [Natronorubrum thiooxidans]|uniref:Lactoylglutathione lyase n=1 Tax=Natronorubrum thiooxidans TaxID=308853 RepID=A0A1N7GL49_9EURY|nr:VOC family protein [Natronorubrum thiooxidans]SIS13259.1 lactoylglutathione lyase [Natronorubrum thiooxidans]
MELIHININVADADETIEFYEQFGFEESWGFETPDGETNHRYIADNNGIELQLSDTTDDAEFDQGTAWDHLAIGVDDVDAVFEDIDHYGIEKEPGDQPEAGARTAFVYDPDGRKVELVESLDESPN